ncbi:hypothetical protein M422DRAFT_135733, partial [Sphaerobolus stellatus SS14]
LSEAFDEAVFNSGKPLSFGSIPWPILERAYSIQDIEWEAVERFFIAVRRFMPSAEFKKFLTKSQRRFHPDKWRARK